MLYFIIYTCLHLVRNGCHYFQNYLKKNWSLCAIQGCVESKLCHDILLCLTCFESMVVIVHGKNKRCGDETIYTLWCSCPSNLERWLNLSRHIGVRRWWTPLINLSLTIHGLHVFGFTIANLVNNQPTLLCLPISMGLWMKYELFYWF